LLYYNSHTTEHKKTYAGKAKHSIEEAIKYAIKLGCVLNTCCKNTHFDRVDRAFDRVLDFATYAYNTKIKIKIHSYSQNFETVKKMNTNKPDGKKRKKNFKKCAEIDAGSIEMLDQPNGFMIVKP
jgi:hypothetical protein